MHKLQRLLKRYISREKGEGMTVTRDQLYEEYLAWLDGGAPLEPDSLFRFPLTDRDAVEDAASVTNRLYFIVPDFHGHRLRLFIFFEENCFQKDANGDLSLSHSAFFIPKC